MAGTADRAIDELAGRQHGVVARRQLLEAGVASHVIDRRLRAGRLRRVHQGVYQVGPVTAPRAREMAAVLACGPSAVLSHGSAAALWRLTPERDAGPVEVITRAGARSRRGLRVRRIGTLRADEVTRLSGIPVTTAPRTLYDLAGTTGSRELERAVAEAFALRLATPARLRTVVSRHARTRGSASLRAILEAGEPARTRSEAEERFLELIRKAGIQRPAANVKIGRLEVDFLWQRERLVVEIDGSAFHSSPRAFERDRRRDAVLIAAGYRVARITWRQLAEEPEAVLARLVKALAVVPAG